MNAEDELLERYLDGLLPPEEAERFERTLARSPELAAEARAQERVDAFLARRFHAPRAIEAPAAPEAAARRGGKPAAAARVPVGRGMPGVAADLGDDAGRVVTGPGGRGWLAAAAAVLVGLALGLALRDEGGPPRAGGGEPLSSANASPSPPSPTRHDAAEPAPTEEPRGLTPRSIPDLAALYASLSEPHATAGGPWGELVALPRDGGAGTDGSLEDRLAARYDACLDLSTPACIVLGPYAAPEWPSATVMVGYCDGGAPTLLVVDDQTMTGCGLTPRTGTLSPFYKEVNGVAVWEVTTGDRPLLLDGVRSCRE
jgi:hypothetical protein